MTITIILDINIKSFNKKNLRKKGPEILAVWHYLPDSHIHGGNSAHQCSH